MKDYPWGKGTPTWVRDVATNDSDKTFTVPAGKVWDLRSITAELVTTATVGNRILNISITDGTNPVWVGPVCGNVAASQQGQYYGYVGARELATTVRRRLMSPTGSPSVQTTEGLPDMLLPAGYVIRIYDQAAIDAAADDLYVALHYVEYDA